MSIYLYILYLYFVFFIYFRFQNLPCLNSKKDTQCALRLYGYVCRI